MTRSELYLALTEALAAAKPAMYDAYRECPRGCDVEDVAANTQWQADCGHVATALSAHHRTFDRARFLRECGVQP